MVGQESGMTVGRQTTGEAEDSRSRSTHTLVRTDRGARTAADRTESVGGAKGPLPFPQPFLSLSLQISRWLFDAGKGHPFCNTASISSVGLS